MKTIADLIEALRQGSRPVVTFGKAIEDVEGYAEAGMRARVIGAGAAQSDGCVKLKFDFSEFEAFNASFESSNYYDKQGNPTLNARQAGYYQPHEDVYFMQTDALDNLMAFESDTTMALMAEYRASGFDGSYVSWLESQVLVSRIAA